MKRIIKIKRAMLFFERHKSIAPFMSQAFSNLTEAYLIKIKTVNLMTKSFTNIDSMEFSSIDGKSDELFGGDSAL